MLIIRPAIQRPNSRQVAQLDGAVLGSLSDDDLQAAYDHILEQFALALLIGAHETSEWSDGKLVINANHGPIHLLRAAFHAVKLEVQRRV